MEKLFFSEEQRHNQWWLWVIMTFALLAVLVPFAYGIYDQVVLDEPFGNEPMSTEGLIVTGAGSVLIMLIIFFVVFKARLLTKITTEGIWYSYPPLFRKGKWIRPDEISRYEVITFHAFRQYGGYGMKRRRRHRQAYIMSGNTGLMLYFKNGQKLLIGTQKKQAITYAMEKVMGTEHQ